MLMSEVKEYGRRLRMKVTPKESVVCDSCNTKDSFIYFAGPGGSRRVCMVCEKQQTGIDMHSIGYSDDLPFVPKCLGDYRILRPA